MKTVTRRNMGQLCALLAGALASGCLSPTLPPYPPPAKPQTISYEAPGLLRLKGMLGRERATVLAINSETGDIGGKLVTDGSYSFLINADPGQELELFYQVGNDFSDSTVFKAPGYDQELPDASASSGSTAEPSPPNSTTQIDAGDTAGDQ